MGLISAVVRSKDQQKFYDQWEFDSLGVSQQEGQFDLADNQTAFLAEQGLTEDQMNSIETQFIDELYGTSEGQTIVDGKNVEHSQAEWQTTYYDDEGAIAQGESTDVWGLDLRRTMQDEDGNTITASHPEFYEHLTRGEVDWASYQDDPKYNEVWAKIGEDKGKLTSDEFTDAEKADWVRKANYELNTPFRENEGKNPSWLGPSTWNKDHLDWEKYDKDKIFRDKENNLFIDGDKQPTLKDLWANDEGRLTVNAPGEHTAIKKRRQVPRPVIPGISWDGDTPSLTHKNKIKLPRNIKGLFRGGKPTGGTK